MVRAVREELLAGTPTKRRRLVEAEADGGPVVATHDLVVGSPAAAMYFGHLRPSRASQGGHVGEDESVAWCACEDTDAVFVSTDKGAIALAVAELGGHRVASPFDVWVDLRDSGLVATDDFDTVCARTAAHLALPGTPLRLR